MNSKKRTFVECKDWISYSEEMSNEDAGICWKAILRFQNGEEVGELPYAVKIVFKHMQHFFIEQEEEYEKVVTIKSENGKKGGRPPKQKPKKANGFSKKLIEANQTIENQTKTKESKQKLTDTVTDTEIIPNGIINNSNELLEDNSNQTSLLNNTIPSQKNFGNEEINEIMQMISEINEGAMDGSIAKNRQFANHLLTKIKKMPKVLEGKILWDEVLSMVIEVCKDDPYHANKLTSPERIYKNRGTLVSLARTKYQEIQKKQQSLDDGVF